METITLAIAIGLVITISSAVWKLATYLRHIERQITNHQRHDLERIEMKLDAIKEDVYHIKGDISSCPLKVKNGQN